MKWKRATTKLRGNLRVARSVPCQLRDPSVSAGLGMTAEWRTFALAASPKNCQSSAMKILFRIIFVLIVLAGAAYLYALSIPAHQTHTRTTTLKETPDAVFALLTDLPNFPKWNRNMVKLEMLPPVDGKEATRQTFKGNMQMTIITSESTPPKHLVRSMGDIGGPFEGSWTYEISPTTDGSQIVLTEQATMNNAFFRLMVKLFGPTKYMDEHLEDMAKHFGKTAVIR
jgi:uncharacterized protein YndB with AHSA1/START domain